MIRARDNRGKDDLGDFFAGHAFDLQQLQQPHRVFVARPARVGRDTPARLQRWNVICAVFKQREDHIGVSDIGRQKHG